MTSPTPNPDLAHLLHLTDDNGTFEHALFTEARPEHGYCTDDMARVLVVASREPVADPQVRSLIGLCLAFLDGAINDEGRCRNRMDQFGAWTDSATVDDCWGRSLWGLGAIISTSDDGEVRQRATTLFERAATQRSPFTRSMVFAAIGAADLLTREPGHQAARGLLGDAADMLTSLSNATSAWPWPEERLTYANAAVPEAMIAAGAVLDRPRLIERGLELLGWLCDREANDGHLSVTPAGGAGPWDARPWFDQQPIEVAAMADACFRAARYDTDPRWFGGVRAAVAWFLGDNDSGIVMWDERTGGGFDGLEFAGANQNQGAESTLALLSTLQRDRSLQLASA